jgi:hypothetical protein
LEEVLTVVQSGGVQSGGGGVDKNARKLKESSKIGTVSESLIAQPEEIWTNGDDGGIQRIKKVLNLKYPGPILQSSDCR